ncbi:hypothetical protein [Tissierella praeacuta]|uniref:hypothetical protein n=1 Tax=Tissierella praeacuta TaxID=43131 RepID=UPI0028AB6659|nr:hypothetical protein [Tissierella praeacuta]
MTFFTDKWTIAEMNSNNIMLFRKSKEDILLERITSDINANSKEIIAKDVLEEYDIAIDLKNNIYILYQSREGHLILNIFGEKKKEKIQLTSERLPEVFDLNIMIKDEIIHIFYLIKALDAKEKYKIHHYYYNGSIWNDHIVGEIIVNKVLNPIKLTQNHNNILLLYYNNNKVIELKEFSIDKLEWSSKKVLIDTESDKLFLDICIIDDIIHLTYCEYSFGNLVIKYNKFHYDNGIYVKYSEETISNEGSPSHPNIIFFQNKLWITWVELNKIMSRYSEDRGESWEQTLYMWNESRGIDFVRYKYLTITPKDNVQLQYSFGSIYPEIRFMGFGPLDNVVEVPVKKKKLMSIPRI